MSYEMMSFKNNTEFNDTNLSKHEIKIFQQKSALWYVCVCVCVCVRVCVRACVRACVCVCDLKDKS